MSDMVEKWANDCIESMSKALFKKESDVKAIYTAMFDGKEREVVDIVYDSQNKQGAKGVKHDFSKPQMSLLPMKDLEGVVRVLEFGMKKYARGDWQFVKDGAFRYLDAGLRHLAELSDPMSVEDLRHMDPESGLPSIDHAICSLIFARHFIFKEEGDDK